MKARGFGASIRGRDLALLAGMGVCGIVFAPRTASAQSKACVQSYETAQEQRVSHDLLKARELLNQCIRACPAPFRDECVGWKVEVDEFLASVRLKVRDAAGQPIAIQKAFVDEREVDPSAEILVAPGEHSVHVEARERAYDQRVTTKAGQRNLVVEWTTDAAPRPAATPDGTSAPTKTRSKVPSSILFSAGAATLVASLSLAIYGHVRRSDLESSCAPRCEPDRVDAIATAFWTSAGLGAASVLAAAGGILLWPRSPISVGATSVSAHFTF